MAVISPSSFFVRKMHMKKYRRVVTVVLPSFCLGFLCLARFFGFIFCF